MTTTRGGLVGSLPESRADGMKTEFECTSASLRAIRIGDGRSPAASSRPAGDRAVREMGDVLYIERPVTDDDLFDQLDSRPDAAVCVGLSSSGQVIAAVRQGSCVVVVEARFDRRPAMVHGGASDSAFPAALISGVLLWLAATGRIGPVVGLQPASG